MLANMAVRWAVVRPSFLWAIPWRIVVSPWPLGPLWR